MLHYSQASLFTVTRLTQHIRYVAIMLFNLISWVLTVLYDPSVQHQLQSQFLQKSLSYQATVISPPLERHVFSNSKIYLRKLFKISSQCTGVPDRQLQITKKAITLVNYLFLNDNRILRQGSSKILQNI